MEIAHPLELGQVMSEFLISPSLWQEGIGPLKNSAV